jgi:hypothetical protein
MKKIKYCVLRAMKKVKKWTIPVEAKLTVVTEMRLEGAR